MKERKRKRKKEKKKERKKERKKKERKERYSKKDFENQHYELIQVGDNYQLTFKEVTP